MTEILNENKLKSLAEKYLKDNKSEIDKIVSKKVGTAVNSAVAQAFSTGGYTNDEGWARKMIFGIVDKKVKSEISSNGIFVDTDDIANRVKKAVEKKLKDIDVNIRF